MDLGRTANPLEFAWALSGLALAAIRLYLVIASWQDRNYQERRGVNGGKRIAIKHALWRNIRNGGAQLMVMGSGIVAMMIPANPYVITTPLQYAPGVMIVLMQVFLGFNTVDDLRERIQLQDYLGANRTADWKEKMDDASREH